MVFKTISEKTTKFIPESRDIYDALKPLHIICQFIGLAPYKTVLNEDGSKTYDRTIWCLIRCTLQLILYVVGVIGIILMQEKLFGDNMEEFLKHLQNYFISLIALVCIGFACIFAHKIVEAFKYIDEIDKAFQALAVWMPYRKTFLTILINLTFLSLLGFGMSAWFLLTLPSNASVWSKETFEFELLSLPFTLLVLLMESQYVHYLNLLRYRFSLLNEYLEALARETKSYNSWVSEENDAAVETSKISKNILKSVEIISNPISIIEKVTCLHIKLSDAALLINAAFSVQLLFRITIAFISIVTALYVIGVNFSNPNANSSSLNVNIMFTTWAGISVLELVIVVWITNFTCEEANKCPRLMHKIRNATKNAKLQDVIEMYSLQMYHNRLEFYVCGLFPLDYTLLHTIVAGVTTYLVILIQFNSTSYSANSNNSTTNNASANLSTNTQSDSRN